MGGVALDELQPFDGYSCPWCSTKVMVVSTRDAVRVIVTDQDTARVFMEAHLDGHFSIGLPIASAA